MHSPSHSSPSTPGSAGTEEMDSKERKAAFVLLFLILVLRLVYVFRYAFDSDEPQHLHVIWGWVNGLLQYRDVFDNHTPLFHMLFAPLLALIGEREDALFFMRLAMLPLYLGCLWTVYIMGCELFSRRVGVWATVLAGLLPAFFLCSVEFRTDDLWTLLWLLSIGLMVTKPPSLFLWLTIGVLLGSALGVSVKSIIMYLSLASAGLGTLLISGGIRHLSAWLRENVRYPVALLLGISITPSGLILFFHHHGALSAFWYGTLQHNILPGSTSPWTLLARFGAFGLFFLLLSFGVNRLHASETPYGKDPRKVFLLLTAGGYLAAVGCLWPIHTTQTYLPVCPLILLLATPAILSLPASHCRRWLPAPFRSFPLSPLTVALIELVLVLIIGTPWKDGTREQVLLCREVLSLTNPADFVMDQKGETIFRKRPFYFALETLTRERIRLGQIQDYIPESLKNTETCVATLDNEELPPRGRKFLLENYLTVGRLRVAGRFLPTPVHGRGTSCVSFDVLIPSRYILIDENGTAEGLLDGTRNDRARYLAAGSHEFCPAGSVDRIAFIWAQAVDRGFSPFPGRN